MLRSSWKSLTAVPALLALTGWSAAAAESPRPAPPVRVQVGDQTDGATTRLVLRVPDGERPVLEAGACGGRIALSTAAGWPLDKLNGTRTERLSSWRAEDDGRTLTVRWPCGARVAEIRERDLLILDVAGPPTPRRKPAVPAGEARAAVAQTPGAAPVPQLAEVPSPEPSAGAGIGGAAALAEPPTAPAPMPPAAAPMPSAPMPAAAPVPRAPLPPRPAPRPAVAARPIAPLERAVKEAVDGTLAALQSTAKPPVPGAPPAAAAEPPPPPPPPIGPFDLAGWAGPSYLAESQRLQDAVAAAAGTARIAPLLALARFQLAWALPEEGRASVEAAGALGPAPDEAYELRLLGDAFRALDGTADRTASVYARRGAASSPDHAVWRAATLAPADWPAARNDLPHALRRLLDYPPALRVRLLTLLAAAAGESDRPSLELIVQAMITLEGGEAADGRIDFHRGRLAELAGDTDRALSLYDRAGTIDGPFGHQAQVRAIELRRKAGLLGDGEAIAALEALRYGWRGDLVEADTLLALGAAYVHGGRTAEALDVFATLGRRFGSTARGAAASEAAGKLLTAVLDRLGANPGGADALALQTRYGALVARLDGKSQALRVRLARLLARDGFAQAAARAYHALLEDAPAAERPALGAELARLLIDDGRAGEALEVLARTGDAALPPALSQRRALLRGEALLAEGEPLRAMEAVRGLPGAAPARLGARSLFEAEAWGPALAAYSALLAGPGPHEPDDAALATVAAYRAGDHAAVRRLAASHGGALAGTRWDGLPEALAGAEPVATAPLTQQGLERELAAADTLATLFRRWQASP